MLTEEQIIEIKKHLFKQLEHLPIEQQEDLKRQIAEMDDKELEEFLIKNNLIQEQGQIQGAQQQTLAQQNPFRLIVEEKMPSYKIDENAKALAVLEINPLSKGHTIVIPKITCNVNKLPTQAFTLAKKIAKRLKSKLKAKSVNISTTELFGEGIINVVPIYEGEKQQGKRGKALDEELAELQKKLKAKSKEKIIKIDSTTKDSAAKPKKTKKLESEKQLPKAPVRIP